MKKFLFTITWPEQQNCKNIIIMLRYCRKKKTITRKPFWYAFSYNDDEKRARKLLEGMNNPELFQVEVTVLIRG